MQALTNGRANAVRDGGGRVEVERCEPGIRAHSSRNRFVRQTRTARQVEKGQSAAAFTSQSLQAVARGPFAAAEVQVPELVASPRDVANTHTGHARVPIQLDVLEVWAQS